MNRNAPSTLAAALALAAVFALSACDRRDDAAVDDAANPPPAATEPAPNDMPMAPCSARMTRCSSGGSCAKRPLRRSGYQTAHGQSLFRTVRRGRCRMASARSGS